jgi:hypothetical protein
MEENKPVYVLRTCNEDLTSYNDFQWPESGPVEAPDWDSEAVCGRGLHGILWGQGAVDLLDWSPAAKWLVVSVTGPVVDLRQKVKFKSGYVEFCGDRKAATDFIIAKGADPANVVGATVSVGDNQIAVTGYRGTATAGDGGTATAGKWGVATAGRYGTSVVGEYGTATAGDGGSAEAGEGGRISIEYWDVKSERYRLKTGYIGEDGLLPNVLYKLNSSHEFVPVED